MICSSRLFLQNQSKQKADLAKSLGNTTEAEMAIFEYINPDSTKSRRRHQQLGMGKPCRPPYPKVA